MILFILNIINSYHIFAIGYAIFHYIVLIATSLLLLFTKEKLVSYSLRRVLQKYKYLISVVTAGAEATATMITSFP